MPPHPFARICNSRPPSPFQRIVQLLSSPLPVAYCFFTAFPVSSTPFIVAFFLFHPPLVNPLLLLLLLLLLVCLARSCRYCARARAAPWFLSLRIFTQLHNFFQKSASALKLSKSQQHN
jgi:hypothetical protein